MRGLSLSLAGWLVLVSACSSSTDKPSPVGGSPGGSTGGSSPGGTGGLGGFGTGGGPGTGGAPGGTGGAGGAPATGGSGGDGGTGGTTPAADAAPPAETGDGGPSVPAPTGNAPLPGMIQIFDGKTLMGWNGNPSIWTVDAAEMAIHGKTNNGGQLIKSVGTYDTFRVILQEKAVATTNHMGICIWGGAGGFGYSACLDVIPPSGSLWDYNGANQLPGGVGSANNPIKFMWHQVEILANAATGEVLVAVNGKQTTDYTKAGRGKKGPIGLQAHAGASDQMYRDIWVDPAPKELRLLTVKP
jgi:hypothetical protein